LVPAEIQRLPVGELRDGQQVARLGASGKLGAEFWQRGRGSGCLRGDGCQQIVGGFRQQVVDAGFFGLSGDQCGKAGRDVVKRLGNQPANSGRYSVQVFGAACLCERFTEFALRLGRFEASAFGL
jgi:hypothetical protein